MTSDLVSRMLGRRITENVPVPVAAKRSANRRDRKHQLRTAAAMMGMTMEAEGQSIIPDDAEDIDAVTGESGLKLKDTATPEEPTREPDMPTTDVSADEPEEVITPSDILVAPDVTPDLLEPVDPSQVPEPEAAAPAAPPPTPEPRPETKPPVDPLDVLLGRKSPSVPSEAPPVPEEPVQSVESVQASVNASLGVGVSGDALLGQGMAMPDHTPANSSRIVEAFRPFVRR